MSKQFELIQVSLKDFAFWFLQFRFDHDSGTAQSEGEYVRDGVADPKMERSLGEV